MEAPISRPDISAVYHTVGRSGPFHSHPVSPTSSIESAFPSGRTFGCMVAEVFTLAGAIRETCVTFPCEFVSTTDAGLRFTGFASVRRRRRLLPAPTSSMVVLDADVSVDDDDNDDELGARDSPSTASSVTALDRVCIRPCVVSRVIAGKRRFQLGQEVSRR